MNALPVQAFALCTAFWTAMFLYDRQSPDRGHGRFAISLLLGGILAHLGWVLLHLHVRAAHPEAWVDVPMGLSVLFVPLGPLLLARGKAEFRSLPLALAVARLGCLASGCCHGPQGEPVPLWDIAAWVVLHGVLSWVPGPRVVPGFLVGFGAIRLATEPLRAPPPLGEPMIPVYAIAMGWVVLGLTLALCHADKDLLQSGKTREGRAPGSGASAPAQLR